MELINLTPHPVHVATTDGDLLVIDPTGPAARCVMTLKTLPTSTNRGSVIMKEVTCTRITDLLPPRPDTMFIVSRSVAEAAYDRTDVVVPHELVRDDEGRVISCRSLCRRWARLVGPAS